MVIAGGAAALVGVAVIPLLARVARRTLALRRRHARSTRRAAAVAARGPAATTPLPEVRCRAASAFELGQQVGAQMRAHIAESFATDARLAAMVAHFSNGGPGAPLLRAYEASNRARFPRVLAEVDGIAKGCGQPFDTVLLANAAQVVHAARVVANSPEETMMRHHSPSPCLTRRDTAAQELSSLVPAPAQPPVVGCTDIHVVRAVAPPPPTSGGGGAARQVATLDVSAQGPSQCGRFVNADSYS